VLRGAGAGHRGRLRRGRRLPVPAQERRSPHHQGGGFVGLLRGAWHAHLGWIFRPDPPNLARYVKDLYRDGPVRLASALFPLWVALGLLIPIPVAPLLYHRGAETHAFQHFTPAVEQGHVEQETTRDSLASEAAQLVIGAAGGVPKQSG
jgi:hypothetical protein